MPLRIFEVSVYFETEKMTALGAALLALRSLDVEAASLEEAEHYGALIVKALERSVDEWWKR